jgi:hypothetical protein
MELFCHSTLILYCFAWFEDWSSLVHRHLMPLKHFLFLFYCQIPEEEKNAGPRDRLVHVIHFFKDNQVPLF